MLWRTLEDTKGAPPISANKDGNKEPEKTEEVKTTEVEIKY